MKKLWLVVLAALGFASQAGSKTQVTLDQLAAPITTAVMVSVPGKGWTPAQLDSSLVLNTATNPPTLSATGAAGPAFVDAVVPAGTVDGANAVFTLPSAPKTPASLVLIVNGIVQSPGIDFTLATSGSGAATITFTGQSIPSATSLLRAWYR